MGMNTYPHGGYGPAVLPSPPGSGYPSPREPPYLVSFEYGGPGVTGKASPGVYGLQGVKYVSAHATAYASQPYSSDSATSSTVFVSPYHMARQDSPAWSTSSIGSRSSSYTFSTCTSLSMNASPSQSSESSSERPQKPDFIVPSKKSSAIKICCASCKLVVGGCSCKITSQRAVLPLPQTSDTMRVSQSAFSVEELMSSFRQSETGQQQHHLPDGSNLNGSTAGVMDDSKVLGVVSTPGLHRDFPSVELERTLNGSSTGQHPGPAWPDGLTMLPATKPTHGTDDETSYTESSSQNPGCPVSKWIDESSPQLLSRSGSSTDLVSDGEMSFMDSEMPSEWDDLTVLENDLGWVNARANLMTTVITAYLKSLCPQDVEAASSSGSDVSSSLPPTSSTRSGSGSGSGTFGSSRTSLSSVVKRRRSDDDDLDGDDDNGKRPRAASECYEGKLLACPYCKRHPHRYSQHNVLEKHYRHCASTYSTTIPRLKQHLYRVHRRPEHYCSCCFEQFSSRLALDEHSRRRACTVSECPFEEKMTADQMVEIKRRVVGKDREELWFSIFRILFPGASVPASPFVEGVSTEAASSFVSFFQAEAPAMLSAMVATRLDTSLALPRNQRMMLDAVLADSIAQLVQQFDSDFHLSAQGNPRSQAALISNTTLFGDAVPSRTDFVPASVSGPPLYAPAPHTSSHVWPYQAITSITSTEETAFSAQDMTNSSSYTFGMPPSSIPLDDIDDTPNQFDDLLAQLDSAQLSWADPLQ